jgi:hypothetical protein
MASRLQVSGIPSGKWSPIVTAWLYWRDTGQMPNATTMSEQLVAESLSQSISSAEDSPARTSAALASELALEVLAVVSGLSSDGSLGNSGPVGWWLKTSPAERLSGLMPSAQTWGGLVMRAYRSRLRRRMLERRISGLESSLLLPTLTARPYGTNRGGAAGRVGRTRQSLHALAKQGLLPTLTAKGNLLSPGMQKWPSHRLLNELLRKHREMLPTLTSRDYKGPGLKRRQGGVDLPTQVGAPLSPTFCEWFMGFEEGWTVLPAASPRSATRSSRNVPR